MATNDKESSGALTLLFLAVSAIGAFLSGVVAVIGLIIARPEVLPQQLRDAVVRIELHQMQAACPEQAEPQGAGPQEAEETTGSPPETEPPRLLPATVPQTRPSTDAPLIELLSVSEVENRFVASVRVNNTGPNGIGVGILYSRALFALSDGQGGFCQLRGNGRNVGTLPLLRSNADAAQFRTVAGQTSTSETILFAKNSCTSQITSGGPVSMSGTLLVQDGDVRREESVSFESVALTR